MFAGLIKTGAAGGPGVPMVIVRTDDHALRLCAESRVRTRQYNVPLDDEEKSVEACEAGVHVSYHPVNSATMSSVKDGLGLTCMW